MPNKRVFRRVFLGFSFLFFSLSPILASPPDREREQLHRETQRIPPIRGVSADVSVEEVIRLREFIRDLNPPERRGEISDIDVINIIDSCGPPLYLPVHNDAYLPIIREAIRRGVNVNERDDSGEPLLMRAVRWGSYRIAEYLIAHGADVNAGRREGFTPLMDAVVNGRLSSVRALIAGGANVNAQRPNGQTALIEAIRTSSQDVGDRIEIVRALIAAGANVNLVGRGYLDRVHHQEYTALDLARQRNLPEIIDILETRGARDNTPDGQSLPSRVRNFPASQEAERNLRNHLELQRTINVQPLFDDSLVREFENSNIPLRQKLTLARRTLRRAQNETYSAEERTRIQQYFRNWVENLWNNNQLDSREYHDFLRALPER